MLVDLHSHHGLRSSVSELMQDRKSMGQPISNHQAISMKLADMACRIESARLLTYRAAAYKDAVGARVQGGVMMRGWH